MPTDPANRMAISVHYYTPATFCILEEDADWGKASSTWGTDAEYAELNQLMDMMKTTFADKGYPVIIGEYGCSKKTKEEASVRRFISSVCKAARDRNMCPVLWDVTDLHYNRKEAKFIDEVLLDMMMESRPEDKPVVTTENMPVTTVPKTTATVPATDDCTNSPPYLVCDANCDGSVTLADATAILQSISNPDKYGLSEQGVINADANGEAGITADDAIIIKMIYANMLTIEDVVANLSK